MWLSYISALLRGANIVVELMHVMKRPVLVHCSDGWDRTSQIVSLSELMMDSYYRTMEVSSITLVFLEDFTADAQS